MDLEKERASLTAQRDNAYMVYQQAIGALALLDAIVKSQKAKKDSITIEQFKDMIGAKSIGDVTGIPQPSEGGRS